MRTRDFKKGHEAPHGEIVGLFRVDPEEKEFQ